MFQSIRVFLTLIVVSTMALADVFMTELTDPQNSSTAGRYVELYNNGSEDVNLSTWSVQRWTNGNADPTASSVITLTGYIIEAGSFFIICNDDAKFTATYGMDCHLDIGTGGFADSNGDDNMALLNNGEIVDMFGAERKYIPARKGEYDATLCTDTKAHEMLGWTPTRNLEDYIKSVI